MPRYTSAASVAPTKAGSLNGNCSFQGLPNRPLRRIWLYLRNINMNNTLISHHFKWLRTNLTTTTARYSSTTEVFIYFVNVFDHLIALQFAILELGQICIRHQHLPSLAFLKNNAGITPTARFLSGLKAMNVEKSCWFAITFERWDQGADDQANMDNGEN